MMLGAKPQCRLRGNGKGAVQPRHMNPNVGRRDQTVALLRLVGRGQRAPVWPAGTAWSVQVARPCSTAKSCHGLDLGPDSEVHTGVAPRGALPRITGAPGERNRS